MVSFVVIAGLVSIICGIIILIGAFQNSVWKGLLSIFCGIYLLYFALFEFQHPNKWLIVVLWLVCGGYMGAMFKVIKPVIVFH